MLNITHIVPFEKYIDCAITFWSDIQVNSTFISTDDFSRNQGDSFVKQSNKITLLTEEQLYEYILTDAYDVIIFYSLPTSKYKHITLIPNGKVVIWASVGYDIYYSNHPFKAICQIKLYHPKTQRYISQQNGNTLFRKSKVLIKNIIHFYKYYQIAKKNKSDVKNAMSIQCHVLRRIDYISTVLDDEYRLLRLNENISGNFFRFKYIGKMSDEPRAIQFYQTRYLLIGNSGDESNNHLDIIDIIKKRQITTELYLPLAYGGTSHYINTIEEQLKALHITFRIQQQFLDKLSYNENLFRCRAAIFGHLRQQAMGNISMCIRQGCKVFLFSEGILYKALKKQGFIIFSIEEDLTQENIDIPLSIDQINYNRSLMLDYSQVLENVRNDLKNIEESISFKKRMICQ